jgi:phosphotriesterase-related protein
MSGSAGRATGPVTEEETQMAAMVQTVTGPVAADELGYTLVHEHVFCASAGIATGWPALFGGREALIERATAILKKSVDAGVRSMVDATPFDLGRDVTLLGECAERSGMRIIASSGHWLVPSPTFGNRTVAQLADLFITELTTGADGTTIPAGMIKVASEERIEPFDRKVLEAAVIAHRETGAGILTHAAARNRIGEAQADVLEELGMDPGRVIIGHSDDTTDIGYITGLADRGFLIGMDRIACGQLPEYGAQRVPDRLKMIKELVDRGYAGSLTLSTDDPICAPLLTDEDQRRHEEANPDAMGFIPFVAVPGLRDLGVDDAAIHAMTVEAPRRWLAGA